MGERVSQTLSNMSADDSLHQSASICRDGHDDGADTEGLLALFGCSIRSDVFLDNSVLQGLCALYRKLDMKHPRYEKLACLFDSILQDCTIKLNDHINYRNESVAVKNSEVFRLVKLIPICVGSCTNSGLEKFLNFVKSVTQSISLEDLLLLVGSLTREMAASRERYTTEVIRETLLMQSVMKSVIESDNLELAKLFGQVLNTYRCLVDNEFAKAFVGLMDVPWIGSFVQRFTILCSVCEWLVAPERVERNDWMWSKIQQVGSATLWYIFSDVNNKS